MPLTERQVATLPPGRHYDGRGDGLCLLVRPAGRRLWVQRLSVGGKVREMGHGAYPAVTLAEARRRARSAKAAADAGQDPLSDRKAAKAAARAPAAAAAAPEGRTLRDALEAYLGAHAPAWRSSKTEKLTRAMLERYAGDLLARPVAEIGLEDVRAVLAPLWGPKLETATKLRTRLEGVLEYAIAAGWRQGPNPAVWRGGLRPLLARPDAIRRTRHHPALAWERVPGFLSFLGHERGNAGRALRLAVLTACRSGEVRGADWSEFDLEARLWTIPARRMKSGRDHRVPLSPPALALLHELLPADGAKLPERLLFPNTGTDKPFSDMALLAVVKRMDAADRRAGLPGWRDARGERMAPHGFRAAFRSWCGDHGHDRDLAEMALAHTVGDETERAYARSDLLARRRALMDAWGAHCAGEGAAEDARAPGAAVVRMVA
ncbi:MAG: integrase arm-type DNA-binding domain-containing protein [Acetobacteraceae bacterium]|nr:integrase arm-type DNA-binding domain-containing protein [Acetobacteraceae bacterium]